jgi:hypothetical protein
MKTFKHILAVVAVSLTLAACGPDGGDTTDNIDIQTEADGGAPNARPAATSGSPGAGGAPAVHCRSFGKFGEYCTAGK